MNRMDRHAGEVESIQNADPRFGAASHPGGASSGMWERDGVMGAIDHALERARSARGDALFVIGEAGLGKSSLLELARHRAGADFRTGTGVGYPTEAIEPFGLVWAAIDSIDGSSPLALQPGGTSSPDRVTRIHQVVRLLETLDRPSLLLLDDCHWADAD